MDAIERSNVVLAKVLNLAMEHCLSHWNLSFDDLGLDEQYETFFYPCVEWLEAEGLIRVGEYARTMGGLANGSIINVSLTSRGMALLGAKFTVNGETETVSEAVKKTTQGGGETYRIGEIIGGVLGGFTKTLGS